MRWGLNGGPQGGQNFEWGALAPWPSFRIATGFGYRSGRNGEFCVAVGPATRAAGMLAEDSYRRWLLILAGHPTNTVCMLAYLGPTLADSKVLKGMSSLATDVSLR